MTNSFDRPIKFPNVAKKKGHGFSLIEVVIGIALLVIVMIAAYGAFTSLLRLANANQARILAVQLADEQFEIIRNLPYVNVGLTNGIPQGVLPQNQILLRGGFSFDVKLVIRNLDLATSSLQASSKLVEVDITCPTCQTTFDPVVLTGQISPANLQSAASGGAIVVQVFDSKGFPVQDATVVVQSTATSSVTNTDTTNKDGVLQIIGVPPGTNVYRITASKAGYSTARTYPLGGSGNPNPTSPDLTVVNGQVTQVSLSIDKTSTLSFSTVSPMCSPVGNYHFNMIGAKQIGQDIPKYSQGLVTGGGGTLTLDPMEWDTYTIIPDDAAYVTNGITPSSPLLLNAGADVSVQFVVVPTAGNSLMVNVVDAATGLPLSGASVELSKVGYDETLVTGQGYFVQTDWSGGSGQTLYTDMSKYWSDNGQVDTATSSGNVIMKNIFGSYPLNATGTLESSIFDTGTSSNFYTFSWKPANQPVLAGPAPVSFQFATNPTSTSTPWNYLGPDGTADTYFTVPGMTISTANNDKQFARYMMYLTTQTSTTTPIVSDVSFTYTSGCIPPGQVIFQNISTGDYTISVSRSGYTIWNDTITIQSGWQSQTVPLSP